MDQDGTAGGGKGAGDAPLPDPRRLVIYSIVGIAILALSVVAAAFYAVDTIDRVAINDEMMRARAALAAVASEPTAETILRRDYLFDGARFTDAGSLASGEVSIPRPDGSAVLAWTPRRIGSEMFLHLAPIRIAASAMFVAGIALVIRRLYRMTRELERRRREAQDMALRDALTGLGNRLAFDRWMATAAEEGAESVALLYLDLDDFKSINDRHGHGAGDMLLQVVAQRLSAMTGPGDLVARMGGDEFAFVRRGPVGRSELSELAADVGTSLTEPVRIGGVEVALGSSIGAAIGAPQAPELVAAADAALYRAKALPGHTFVLAEAA